MKEGFFRSGFIAPEEKKLHQFRGASLKEVIEYLEGREEDAVEDTGEENWKKWQDQENQSIFDGFLELLRAKGVRVSTPEWLQFLQVISKKTNATELKKLVSTQELLNKVRLFAKTTLVKDKADEAAFHEAFDQYFELAAKVYNLELQEEQKERAKEDEAKQTRDGGTEPDIKEQLGIKEVKENDAPEDGEHEDNEEVHGGKTDQHNDILKKEDLSKQGGGNKKEGPKGDGDKGEPSEGKGKKGDKGQGEGDKGEAGAGKGDKGEPSGKGKGSYGEKTDAPSGDSSAIPTAPKNVQQELTEDGYLVGGGKGKSINAQRVVQEPIVHEGERLDKQAIQEREKRVGRVDRRTRYEVRPDRASMREVIRNIRRIILDVSETKSKNVDLKRTVGNFARRDYRFDYEREREKQPEIVLFIDVGGPVNEWAPLVQELSEEMTKGLTKLEIYLFHNNIYGFVWPIFTEDLTKSNIPKRGTIKSVQDVVKKRKKVIIYGDGEMSGTELHDDMYKDRYPDQERITKSYMDGEQCLKFIQRKSDSVVWINPVFKKEWEERDGSGVIQAVNEIIPMHDLTVGGVEDAIKELMKK